MGQLAHSRRAFGEFKSTEEKEKKHEELDLIHSTVAMAMLLARGAHWKNVNESNLDAWISSRADIQTSISPSL